MMINAEMSAIRNRIDLNARRRRGHLWQNRFFSCAVEGNHLWTALRYVERNPVWAGMVRSPQEYPWSTAARHVAGQEITGKMAPD